MSDSVVRSSVGQLMATVKLLCIMRRAGREDVVRDIESCMLPDLSGIAHGKRLDRILKEHIALLEADDKQDKSGI